MQFIVLCSRVGKRASRSFGAILLLASLLAGSSCNKKVPTPDWGKLGSKVASKTTAPPLAAPVAPLDGSSGEAVPDPEPSETQEIQAPAADFPDSRSNEGLRFITYNVENWLTMDRYVNHKAIKGGSKPESEKQAVIRLLARLGPDVIGLCEIGQATDLAEIQDDLKAAGVSLPHSQYVGGSDPTRHLGFLSRFPITSTAKAARLEYQLAGQTFAINRGILDVTIEAHAKSYRFVGAHLKSKRDSEQGDQEAIRLNEARLLRDHVSSIIKTDPNVRLIVYGDFNDTRATPAIKMITGNYNDPGYLTSIPAKDSHQDAWTHYWALHDIYSRIDYIMVSRGMRKEVNFPASRIIDDVEWNKASDHRAVMAIFK